MSINLSEIIVGFLGQRDVLSNNSLSIKSSLKTLTLLCSLILNKFNPVTNFAQFPSSIHLETLAQTPTLYNHTFSLPSCDILLRSVKVVF